MNNPEVAQKWFRYRWPQVTWSVDKLYQYLNGKRYTLFSVTAMAQVGMVKLQATNLMRVDDVEITFERLEEFGQPMYSAMAALIGEVDEESGEST